MSDIASILDKLNGANTIPELFSCAVSRFQNQVAIKTKVKNTIIEKTYLQMKNDTDALIAKFEEMGIKHEKIAIVGTLCYEWIVTYFGVTGSSNIVVPIDKDLNIADIEKLVKQADVSVLFFDESEIEVARYMANQCGDIKQIICFQDAESFQNLFDFTEAGTNIKPIGVNVKEDETAMIVFTSGIAGDNKGAMLSHKNICHDVICSVYLIGKDAFRPGECTVPVLPPHHMFAITPGILATILYYGVTVCLGGGLNDYLKNVKQFRPVLLIIVPMIVEGIYKRIWREAKRTGKESRLKFLIKLSNILLKLKIDIRRILFREILDSLGGELRIMICGGSYLDSNLVNKFRDFGITLLNGYGITECSPVVSCNRPKGIKRNSVGLVAPEPYCQVKIMKDEILVRGSIVMEGYYQDEKNTLEVFEGEWFKTGDLGYLDKDNYLYITGRKKDLIILKDGNNISPVELERLIEQHPLVDSVLVYATEKNRTEILVAAIHPNYAYAAKNGIDDSKVALEEMIASLNQNSPLFKRIRMIEFYEEAFNKAELKREKRFI